MLTIGSSFFFEIVIAPLSKLVQSDSVSSVWFALTGKKVEIVLEWYQGQSNLVLGR